MVIYAVHPINYYAPRLLIMSINTKVVFLTLIRTYDPAWLFGNRSLTPVASGRLLVYQVT